MPRLYVAFDTNAYRSIGVRRFEDMRRAERARGVQGIALYSVVEELAAHLVTREDPDFGHARAAIRRIASHCSTFVADRHTIVFDEDARQRVERVLFGTTADVAEATDSYGWLVGAITESAQDDDLSWLHESTTIAARRVHSDRLSFAAAIAEIRELTVQRLGLSTGEFDLAMRVRENAAALGAELDGPGALRDTATLIIRQLAHPDVPARQSTDEFLMAERLVGVFRTALEMFLAVLRGALIQNWSLVSRATIACDFRIAFAVSNEARILGRPVWLISEDKDVRAGAAAAGLSSRVVRPADYRALLNGDIDELIARLDATR